MDKQTIISRLVALPAEIAKAEREVIRLEQDFRWYKTDLQSKEDEILNSGVIDGKNEAIRNAQLRQFTAQYRQEVTGAENSLLRAQSELRLLQTELRALQSVADLLKGAA